jgi:O-antigen/teichoic acid export membrane protein
MLILGFICRSIFIRYLGVEYQGLNSLFSSLISMLSIAQLGIGTALVYSMYQSIAEQNIEVIKSIMRFYKNCYRLIAGVVFAFGMILLPFLSFFSSYKGIDENIYFIFLLFLVNSVVGYLFTYKRSIIYANQENYLITICDTVTWTLMDLAQIGVLIIYKNFIIYLVIATISTFLENLFINFLANKKYPYLKEKNIDKIPTEILSNLKKQILGLFMGQIGSFVVFGTDSIIISRFLGLNEMGIYSNYLLLSTAISGFLGQISAGIVASAGNLLTEKDYERNYTIFKRLNFIIFWIYTLASIGIFVVSGPFISIWLGKNYLLSSFIIFFFVLNFYISGTRVGLGVFVNAAGIYYETRWIPLIESAINLASGLILVHFIGLAGIIIATILSTLYLMFMIPKYTLRRIFKKNTNGFYRTQLFYLVIFLMMLFFTGIISQILLVNQNLYVNFGISLLICLIIPNLFLFILFRKSSHYEYLKNLILSRFAFLSKSE